MLWQALKHNEQLMIRFEQHTDRKAVRKSWTSQKQHLDNYITKTNTEQHMKRVPMLNKHMNQ